MDEGAMLSSAKLIASSRCPLLHAAAFTHLPSLFSALLSSLPSSWLQKQSRRIEIVSPDARSRLIPMLAAEPREPGLLIPS